MPRARSTSETCEPHRCEQPIDARARTVEPGADRPSRGDPAGGAAGRASRSRRSGCRSSGARRRPPPGPISPRPRARSSALRAERILPRTDTPGAIDVGVPAFIDLLLRRVHEPGRAAVARQRARRGRGGGAVGARRVVCGAHGSAAGRRAAEHRHRSAGPGSELVRTAAVRDRARLLHVGTGREERASLRSRARRLRRLSADRSGGPPQLDDLIDRASPRADRAVHHQHRRQRARWTAG